MRAFRSLVRVTPPTYSREVKDVVCAPLSERRHAARYSVALRVSFRESGLNVPIQGSTSNMSTSGAYIISESAPPVGSDVDITWFLRAPDTQRQLHGSGLVVRVEPLDETSPALGFAVRFFSEVILEAGTGKPQ